MSAHPQSTIEGTLESGYVRLAHRVESEFRRMPTLALTTSQLSDWLDVDDTVSVRVLNALVTAAVLERGTDERYRLFVTH